MHLDLAGRLAVVTGGANGIGFAAARALAECGACVWIFDLERERPGERAAELGGRGCPVDVTDPESIGAAFEVSGTPDIVVANAGIATYQQLTETTREAWDRTLAVNLSGAFHTLRLAAQRMKMKRSGAIVVTASTNSFDGESDLTAYNSAKAGLLGLVRTAANELGPYRIRVNAVCPGLIRTRLTEGHFTNPEVIRPYLRHIPLGRGGMPEDVANAIAFLASDLAAYVTGATLFVDGGQMASKFGTWSDETAEFADAEWRLR
jgi:NAD(P)-dependent dehydrogenase (short-subunit alcohol dehydrogenase family)